ncbi:MAG: hypothetical protein JXL80_05730 [Planctomycetes bacterium]|nr:hypothetical protein [Planctomycetota bacterium]
MTEISPDANVDRPIGALVFWTARASQRVARYAGLPGHLLRSPVVQRVMDRDRALHAACAVALRLRADEVVRYAADLGVECTEYEVIEDPLPICGALMNHVAAMEEAN